MKWFIFVALSSCLNGICLAENTGGGAKGEEPFGIYILLFLGAISLYLARKKPSHD